MLFAWVSVFDEFGQKNEWLQIQIKAFQQNKWFFGAMGILRETKKFNEVNDQEH